MKGDYPEIRCRSPTICWIDLPLAQDMTKKHDDTVSSPVSANLVVVKSWGDERSCGSLNKGLHYLVAATLVIEGTHWWMAMKHGEGVGMKHGGFHILSCYI